MAVMVLTMIVQLFVCMCVTNTQVNAFCPLIFIHLETYMEIGTSKFFIYIAVFCFGPRRHEKNIHKRVLLEGDHGHAGI